MIDVLQPWVGTNYKRGAGLLVLSESVYCWRDEKTSSLVLPKPDHHEQVTVQHWGVKNFGKKGNHYPATLTRTLCSKPYPTEEERLRAWNNVAYASYVQRPMKDRRERPTAADMTNSEKPFLDMLDVLRPSRVLITGLVTWKYGMPHTQIQRDDRLQAYRRSDEGLSWCLAVPHPSSRKFGDTFKWREISALLEAFVERTDLEPF